MPPTIAAVNHNAIKPESRPSSGYLIASQAAMAQAFTPMNAAKASRTNIVERFMPGTAMNAKLKATATVALSHTAHSNAVLPDSVGGTLRAGEPADTEIEHYPVKFRADKNAEQTLHARR